MGHMKLNKDKERERFRRWAEKLGMPEFNVAAFDDLVDFHGLKATVEELELAFLGIQRGGFTREVYIGDSRIVVPWD
jgi:hypothetical protein